MSTTKIINYQNRRVRRNFTFDANEVQIDTSGAALVKRGLTTNELFVGTGRLQQNADLSASLPVYARGNAVWDAQGYNCDDPTAGGYFSLNDDSGRDGITPLTPTSHFDFGTVGTVRFKYTPDYGGTPPQNSYLFSLGDSTTNNGLGSLMSITHLAAGGIHVRSYDAAGVSSTFITTPDWLVANGTEYEFEINMNITGATVEGIPAYTATIFIDGILLDTGSLESGSGARDYFALGSSYLPALFDSQGSFRDLQIFDAIQHPSVTSFAGEIPRIVNLYPLESLVVPLETSTAEGFIKSDHAITTTGGSSINYVMRIESANYWIDGGNNLVVSDGSLAQSNPLATWNLPANVATVTAFIAAGARITMIPIIASDPLGLYPATILSNTLTYDFFAIPETCITCTLYGFVKDNCDDITEGTVRVRTTAPIFSQGNLVAFDETVNISLPNGYFEIDLIRPNLISAATSTTPSVSAGTTDTYLLEAKWKDADGKSWSLTKKVLIPDASSIILYSAVLAAEALA